MYGMEESIYVERYVICHLFAADVQGKAFLLCILCCKGCFWKSSTLIRWSWQWHVMCYARKENEGRSRNINRPLGVLVSMGERPSQIDVSGDASWRLQLKWLKGQTEGDILHVLGSDLKRVLCPWFMKWVLCPWLWPEMSALSLVYETSALSLALTWNECSVLGLWN